MLATVVPPIVGPVIAEYYLIRGKPSEFASDERLNWPAIVAFAAGALIAGGNGREGFPIALDLSPSLLGLIVSLVVYVILRKLTR